MASPLLMRLVGFFLSTLLVVIVNSEPQCRNFKSIISFGDSIADTGNSLRISDPKNLPQSGFSPYGETFFHHPTGRYSDGRLIIDFIAEFLGLPHVPPFYGFQIEKFDKGVNFAVAGATALEYSVLVKRGINFPFTPVSLSVQIESFKKSLPHLCGSPSGCRDMIGNALILMGEIGGNDYNYAFFVGKRIQEIIELVPLVVTKISSAITELINMGGKTFLVPGEFPLGCSVAYLGMYQGSKKEDYDPSTGCLRGLNQFSEYYIKQLQAELNRLRKRNPHVTIMYADYYNAILQFYKEPAKYGFMDKPFSACCGVGGPGKFSLDKRCGTKGVGSCKDPSKYVSWDGVHLTEAAYRWMAHGILKGPYADPPFNSSCLNSPIKNNV